MTLKTLRAFLLMALAYLTAFFAARLAFFIAFTNGPHSAADAFRAFAIGARLDLSLSATFACWSVLFAGLAGFYKPSERILKPAVTAYLVALNVAFLVLLLTEIPFYHEYSSRLNHLFFEYFDKPKEMFVTIAGIRLVWPMFGVFLCVVWFLITGTIKLCRRMFDYIRDERPASRAVSLLLIAGLTVLFVRGGFQRRPLNWGAAFFSGDNFMNQTALNGIYNLFQDMQIFYEERQLKIKPSEYFDRPQTALAKVCAVSNYAEEAPNQPFKPPRGVRPNVVMIFMESFAAKYVGALGASPSLTPEFDKLAKEGLFFTEFYANGTRTSRALAAALNSYPPLAGVNLTKKIEAQQKIPGTAHYLARAGYDTMFFYGGDRHFEDMSGFALNNGFQAFYDFTDFKNVKYSNPIGVYDEELFDNLDRILSGQPAGRPFFAAVMTLTNHGPFTVPDYYAALTPGLTKEQRAFRYSDYALARFIAQAKKSPYYKNTVFIIEADHAAFVSDYGADRFHIPLLMLSPFIKQPGVDTRVASQLDLPMTVLRLCGLPVKNTDTAFWGLSLAEREKKGMAFFLDDPYFGVIAKDAMYRESFEGGGYAYSLDGNPSAYKFPQELIDYARGMKEGSAWLFFNRKAGTDWKSEY